MQISVQCASSKQDKNNKKAFGEVAKRMTTTLNTNLENKLGNFQKQLNALYLSYSRVPFFLIKRVSGRQV